MDISEENRKKLGELFVKIDNIVNVDREFMNRIKNRVKGQQYGLDYVDIVSFMDYFKGENYA